MTDALDPPLDKARHLRYLKMCYSGPLPHHYLSNETNRMALAYFILTAIELVTPPPPTPDASATETADEPIPESLLRAIDRPRFRRWILALQHPAGGFCGTPSTALPTWSRDDPERDVQQTAHETVGHANLASTTFALLLLAALADDKAAQSAYSGIRRTRILGWLRKLQREDGSFGESLTELPVNGLFIGGGYDMRHCYLAALARWILRGDVKEGDAGWVEDIDVDGLVKYISNSQTYDGGLAQTSSYEPHAGYAYCGIAALSLLDRPAEGDLTSHPSKYLRSGVRDASNLIRFLGARQQVYVDSQGSAADDDCDDEPESTEDVDAQHIGFNGRWNKPADTCYCFWTAASLANLGRLDLIKRQEARRFMLEKTQHMIGGFGKHAGSPPDVYHTFFGLAALATLGEPSLRKFDTAVAVSEETVRKIEKARRGLLEQASSTDVGDGAKSLEDGLLNMTLSLMAGRGRPIPAWLAPAVDVQ